MSLARVGATNYEPRATAELALPPTAVSLAKAGVGYGQLGAACLVFAQHTAAVLLAKLCCTQSSSGAILLLAALATAMCKAEARGADG